MFPRLFPKLSRFADNLCGLSGGYPFVPIGDNYTQLSRSPYCLHRHKITLVFILLQFIWCLSVCLKSLNSSELEPLAFSLLTRLGAYLLIVTPMQLYPEEYCTGHNSLFRYFRHRIRESRSITVCRVLQLIEGVTTLACLLAVTLMCLEPIRNPASSVQFYSLINSHLQIQFKYIWWLIRILNYFLWLRVFIGYTTGSRYILTNFLTALYLTFHFNKILLRQTGYNAIQKYKALCILFAIFCDLYGCFLLVFQFL